MSGVQVGHPPTRARCYLGKWRPSTTETEESRRILPLGSLSKHCTIGTFILLLSGCASTPDTVLVPVSVPCIEAKDLPAVPVFITDAELLALPDGAFVIALGADRLERIRYMALTEAILSGCVR